MKNEKPYIWQQTNEKNINKIVNYFDNVFTEKYLFDYREKIYPEFSEMEALFYLRISDCYSNGAINVIVNYFLKNNIEINLSNIIEFTDPWDEQLKHVIKISTRHALQLIREFEEKIEKIAISRGLTKK